MDISAEVKEVVDHREVNTKKSFYEVRVKLDDEQEIWQPLTDIYQDIPNLV